MRYFLNRLGFFVLSLWAAVTLNFILPRLVPGNPAQTMIAKAKGQISPTAIKEITQELGLSNAPLIDQYGTYLKHLVTFQWGFSFSNYPQSVLSIIGQGLPWTVVLLGLVTLISVVVGTLVGILIAWRRGGIADSIIPIVTMFGQSIPGFWLGLIFVYYFGFIHNWFPQSHGSGVADNPNLQVGFNASYFMSVIYHGIMPAFVVFFGGISGWIIGMRNNMMTTLGEDYVVFAEAKGVSKRRLIFSYAARNAMLPQLTSLAIALSSIIGGQILIEQVFSYPGIGYGLTTAVTSQDYPLIQGMFLIIAVVGLVINFIVDILYGRLDPRVRRRGAAA